MITYSRPVACAAATVLFVVLTGGPVRDAGASDADPRPSRLPRPYLAVEPWAGFWPVYPEAEAELPLDAVSQFTRWEALRRALAERGYRVSREESAPELARGVGGRTTVRESRFLDRETPAFREGWRQGRDAARAGNARATRRILGTLDPTTLDGEAWVRRLLFAAVVADEDRAEADSLYFRMAPGSAARAAVRLDAWRALDTGGGAAAVRALDGLLDRTPGEEAALGFARWMEAPQEAGAGLLLGDGHDGLLGAAEAVLSARRARLLGDSREAGLLLARIPPGDLPPDWESSVEAIREGGRKSTAASEDVSAYREAAGRFLSGSETEARDALGTWLVRWPESRFRAAAYLLRAHLYASAGRVEDAESDLRIVERQAETRDLTDRARVIRAFLLAQRGLAAEARAALAEVVLGPLGEAAPGEMRFNQIRLGRLLGDADAEIRLMELEEAFPGDPWAGRARVDRSPEGWRGPWKSLPPEPEMAEAVDPPRSGPWGQLLWGEDVLSREAERAPGVELPPLGPEPALEPVPVEFYVDETVPGNSPIAFVDLGLGLPGAALFGGGLAGSLAGIQYRADAAKTFAQQRNDLPDYRRTDWEAGLGKLSGRWGVGLATEGTARTDDNAPMIGLSPTQIEASWWGVRGDVTYLAGEDVGAGVSVAAAGGKVDADSVGRWTTDQVWYAVKGAARAGGARWEMDLRLGSLDQNPADAPAFRNWFHDLRLARSFSGGWYFGARAATYKDRWLLMPVARVERPLGSGGFTAWAGTEPSMSLPAFREVFVADGDWNVPDVTLPAERRYLDLRGGLRWARGEHAFAVASEVHRTGEFRTWRRMGPLWHETRLDDVTGAGLTVSGASFLGPLRVSGKLGAQTVRAEGTQVPYVPRYQGWLELGYAYEGWRWGVSLEGAGGREDEFGTAYNDFLKLDIEGAYRFRTRSLPMGFRNMEIAVEIQNVTDVKDRRWPGIPAYGVGVVAGVRALYGS